MCYLIFTYSRSSNIANINFLYVGYIGDNITVEIKYPSKSYSNYNTMYTTNTQSSGRSNSLLKEKSIESRASSLSHDSLYD